MVRVISLFISLPAVLWVLYEGYLTSLTHALYAINLFAIISSLVLLVIFFADKVPIFFKSRYISKLSFAQLRDTGSIFLYIGLATFLIQDMDFILLSFFLTSYEIAEFSLMHRFFQYSQVALSILIVPLWPYLASGTEPVKRAKKIKRYTYILCLACGALTFLMYWVSPNFLFFWGNGEFNYNYYATLPIALYFFFRCLAAIGVLLLKLHIKLKVLLKHCLLEAIFHALAVMVAFSLTDSYASSITILVSLWCLVTFFTRIFPVARFIFK